MKNFIRNEQGSIMVETLLVLPLHLILLFGVMWISNLSFDQLAFAQYSFTLQGSDAISSQIQDKLWGNDSHIKTNFAGIKNTENWWKKVSGGELVHKFPNYLEGLRVIAKNFFKAEKSLPDEMNTVSGINSFYSKNDSYSIDRSKVETGESLSWVNIARESFPVDTVEYAPSSAKIVSGYTRNPAFAQWSVME